MELVTVSMLSLEAISIAFGCGGTSATLMKPCKPFSVSQFLSAVVMMVGILDRLGGDFRLCFTEGEGEGEELLETDLC